jgi:hypothetical protein
MKKAGGTNQKVEVTDEVALASQFAPLFGEHSANIFSQAEDGNIFKKLRKTFAAGLRVPGIEDPLIHFRQGNNTDCQTVRSQPEKFLANGLCTGQLMNYPVSVDQIRDLHSFASGRVEIIRSA